jgi:predicted nucleic acid-binding protein
LHKSPGNRTAGTLKTTASPQTPRHRPSRSCRICLDDIRAKSSVIPVDGEIAVAAGHLKKREVAGIADAIILATARSGDHKIVTGDPHFNNLPDAIYLGS